MYFISISIIFRLFLLYNLFILILQCIIIYIGYKHRYTIVYKCRVLLKLYIYIYIYIYIYNYDISNYIINISNI